MPVRKSIAIIGEGETEWFYFESVRTTKRYRFKVAPDFPGHTDIDHMVKLDQKYLKDDYDYVVCLVDMDRINSSKKERDKYFRIKKKKENKGIIFIETSPCTEFWFLLHFLSELSTKAYHSCDDILPILRNYMPGYEKTKRYLRGVNLYSYLAEFGDLNRARTNAAALSALLETSPDDISSYSEVYKVFDLLDELEKEVAS